MSEQNIERADGKRSLTRALGDATERLSKKIDEIAAEQKRIDAMPAGEVKDRRNKLLQNERAIVARKQRGLKECIVEARKQQNHG